MSEVGIIEDLIKDIERHRDNVRLDNDTRGYNEIYALAHDHIIDLLRIKMAYVVNKSVDNSGCA